jgi:hypothetical protein
MRARALGVSIVLGLGCLALVGVAIARPDRAELDKLLAETDAIAATVAKIRGLELKKPIARGIMSREQIEKRVLERIGEEYGGDELAAEARAAKKLGLLPMDADYQGVVVGLLTEQIAGFYDPVVKELYLADWIAVSEQRIVMAHEICHALQDQHFDLVKFVKPIKDNADAQLARQALVEGDGVALMVEFMFREMKVKLDPWADDTIVNQMSNMGSMPGMEKFEKAPPFLKDGLMFPYVEGLRLVAFTRRHHPWSRVDDMFKKPPESTEQVMHPEKYFAGEKPVAIKAPAVKSLKKWKVVYSNVLGELGWGSWLRTHGVKPERAKDAAAGWGGDRYVVLAPPGDDGKDVEATVLVLVSVWDADADADEAWDGARDAVSGLVGGAPPASEKADELAVWDLPGGKRAWVERQKNKRVVVVLGVPKDLAEKVRKEIK